MKQPNRDSQRDLELNSNCKRAIKTTMIGALDRFEKTFGYLWGYNKDIAKNDELTENQQKFLDAWLKVRDSVLDWGNNQSRIVDKEFDKFVVRFNGYQYKFKVRQGDSNGNV